MTKLEQIESKSKQIRGDIIKTIHAGDDYYKRAREATKPSRDQTEKEYADLLGFTHEDINAYTDWKLEEARFAE